MKRAGNLMDKIAEPNNLRLAFYKAQKGKRSKSDVQLFVKNLDKNLVKLRDGILNNTVEIGNYHYFKIYDPKERLICASAFVERVLQHAIMNICHPVFESFQISDSYACRLNKGTFAALDRAAKFQQQSAWFLKLDIKKYFNSIHHAILMEMLQRRIKDEKVLRLLYRIIESYENLPGCGLPIGNLTSQYFANHYLALADHFAKEQLHLKYYVRYMDDMVLWSNSCDQLMDAGLKFVQFIEESLQLELNPPSLNKTEHGLTFLGFRVYPGKTLLSQRSKLRFFTKLKAKTIALDSGVINQQEFSQTAMALYGFIGHANSKGFSVKTLNRIRTHVTGSNRVLRGGSWNNNATNCRVSNRNNNNPTNSNNNIGFRLVVPAHSSNVPDGFRTGEQACVSFPKQLIG